MSTLKKLRYIGSADSRQYHYSSVTHELAKQAPTCFLEYVLKDSRRYSQYREGPDGNYCWQDPPKSELLENHSMYWSTYQECTDIILTYLNEDFFEVVVKIFNGDNFSGRREEPRCVFTFNFPVGFIEKYSGIVNGDFNRKMEDEYEDYLEMQKKEWMVKRIIFINNDLKVFPHDKD